MEVQLNNLPEHLDALEELFGKPVAHNQTSALFDPPADGSPRQIDQARTGALANKTREVVRVVLHAPGQVVQLSDDDRYAVEDDGRWRKLDEDDWVDTRFVVDRRAKQAAFAVDSPGATAPVEPAEQRSEDAEVETPSVGDSDDDRGHYLGLDRADPDSDRTAETEVSADGFDASD